jgi:dipeptidase D
MSILAQLEPSEVWMWFDEICKIPRPSKHEGKMIEFLVNFGKSHNLETATDEAGNVVIRKAATTRFAGKPAIILQSHIDMVCEKTADSTHNFECDPIEPRIDGDWVCANNTTLGADDGIGVATQLAILASDSVEHPPLECLFTVDEETGLTGAFHLNHKMLSGRTLINLDSEDEGQIFIGCAGGVNTTAVFDYSTEAIAESATAYTIEVTGLHGGHSGDDIHKGFGNANKILNRILWQALKQFGLQLCAIDGGNLHNAIPRHAQATIAVERKNSDALKQLVTTMSADIAQELKYTEPDLKINLTTAALPASAIAASNLKRLLNGIYGCPNGPIAMSRALPGLVETSTNLASVKMKGDNQIEIVTSQRSSVLSARTDIANMVESVFAQAGATVEHSDGYPGWEPNPDSQILKTAVESYKRLFGKEPEVKAIHAGLECGLFLEKMPGMDMISIGPTLRGVHSPSERIEIKTVKMFYDFLIDILKNC